MSRDEFFGMFTRSFEVFDESTMELVDAMPVGDSLCVVGGLTPDVRRMMYGGVGPASGSFSLSMNSSNETASRSI